MGRKLGKAGGTTREQCQSDPSEGREGWVEASQSALLGKEALARLMGGLQTKSPRRALYLSGSGQPGPVIGYTGAVCGRRGVGPAVVMDFRVQKLGSLVNEAPYGWGSVSHILLAAT